MKYKKPAMIVPLKVAIVSMGRTQREVADAAGIEKTRFSKLLRFQAKPYRDELSALSRVLRQDVTPWFPAVHR